MGQVKEGYSPHSWFHCQDWLHVFFPALTFQDLCIVMCCSKFDILFSCVRTGVLPILLPAPFPQLTFKHFPIFWIKDCHKFIHTGHGPQLLFQIFACMILLKKHAISITFQIVGFRRCQKANTCCTMILFLEGRGYSDLHIVGAK